MLTTYYISYISYFSHCLIFSLLYQSLSSIFRSSQQRCSIRKYFSEISQNSQENTCPRPKACNFILQKETLAVVFSCEFCEICKKTIFTEHLRTTASVSFYSFFLNILSVSSTIPVSTTLLSYFYQHTLSVIRLSWQLVAWRNNAVYLHQVSYHLFVSATFITYGYMLSYPYQLPLPTFISYSYQLLVPASPYSSLLLSATLYQLLSSTSFISHYV